MFAVTWHRDGQSYAPFIRQLHSLTLQNVRRCGGVIRSDAERTCGLNQITAAPLQSHSIYKTRISLNNMIIKSDREVLLMFYVDRVVFLIKWSVSVCLAEGYFWSGRDKADEG